MIGNEYKITTKPKEIAQVLNDHYVQLKDLAGKKILVLQCKVNWFKYNRRPYKSSSRRALRWTGVRHIKKNVKTP